MTFHRLILSAALVLAIALVVVGTRELTQVLAFHDWSTAPAPSAIPTVQLAH